MLPLHQQHKRVREIWKKAADKTLEFPLYPIIENGLKLKISLILYKKLYYNDFRNFKATFFVRTCWFQEELTLEMYTVELVETKQVNVAQSFLLAMVI